MRTRGGVAMAGLGGLLVLAGCGQAAPPAPPPLDGASVPVSVAASPLAPAAACTDRFVAHPLDFTTTVRGDRVHLFDSNGAGVAIGDLDDDGRPDLVFANLDGPDTIFWNEGDFQFRKQELDDTHSRAVNIVDVDGDGRLDLVFTHRAGGVSWWRNLDGAHFARQALPGVLAPAYAMAWGALHGGSVLDLVTASYDAELEMARGSAVALGGSGGVYYYAHQGNGFAAHRLAAQAQALTIALPDLNADGHPAIVVGNDFDMPDAAWVRNGDGWTAAAPFSATTESTMSFATGDVTNSGWPALFAADMKPFEIDVPALADWLPFMATMPKTRKPGDPQVMHSVLQMRGADGRYHDEAIARGVDATGWSWAGQFGDLNDDGWLDLYVVNGMIAAELFPYLPRNELVEPNQALRNDGTGHFAPAPGWGLGATASGRGMSMADLNGDGTLDIVVNNLGAPAQVFENRLCGGSNLEADLRWPGVPNTRAIGARLALYTSAGTYYRDVQASSGYLSGLPPTVQFGLPAGATPQRLVIRWPDGAVSNVESLQAHTRLTVIRR